MSALDDEIQANREICATLRRQVEEARRVLAQREQEAAVAVARLQGLERAAELIKGRSTALHPIRQSGLIPGIAPPSPNKGRQLGAISKIWRGILNEMTIYHPDGATDEEIAEIARAGAIPKLRPRDARRQMQKYQELGFVANQPTPRHWRITVGASRRFGIELPESKAATDSQSVAADDDLSSAERV